jgi:hypothetical protein
MADAAQNEPSIARCVGQFVGHIVSACRHSVEPDAARESSASTASSASSARTVDARLQERTIEGVTYRRLIVEQVVDLGPESPTNGQRPQ